MINTIANKIVRYLIDNSIIAANDQELYLYGFFILFSQILYLIITITIGELLGVVLESVIFYAFFQFIRRYAGGIHASSELKCGIATTTSIFFSLLLIKIAQLYDKQRIFILASFISAILIFVFCPLDTPQKPLTKKELLYFRKKSRMITFLILILILTSWCFKYTIITMPCCLSLMLESVLLVLGIINKKLYEYHI